MNDNFDLDKLRKLMNKKKLNNYKLEKLLKEYIPTARRSTIGKWFNHNRAPSPKYQRALAKIFKVRIEDFEDK